MVTLVAMHDENGLTKGVCRPMPAVVKNCAFQRAAGVEEQSCDKVVWQVLGVSSATIHDRATRVFNIVHYADDTDDMPCLSSVL